VTYDALRRPVPGQHAHPLPHSLRLPIATSEPKPTASAFASTHAHSGPPHSSAEHAHPHWTDGKPSRLGAGPGEAWWPVQRAAPQLGMGGGNGEGEGVIVEVGVGLGVDAVVEGDWERLQAARRAVTADAAARRARQADAAAARSRGGSHGRTSSADSMTVRVVAGFRIPIGSERRGTYQDPKGSFGNQGAAAQGRTPPSGDTCPILLPGRTTPCGVQVPLCHLGAEDKTRGRAERAAGVRGDGQGGRRGRVRRVLSTYSRAEPSRAPRGCTTLRQAEHKNLQETAHRAGLKLPAYTVPRCARVRDLEAIRPRRTPLWPPDHPSNGVSKASSNLLYIFFTLTEQNAMVFWPFAVPASRSSSTWSSPECSSFAASSAPHPPAGPKILPPLHRGAGEGRTW
jgi:hypothetical protein